MSLVIKAENDWLNVGRSHASQLPLVLVSNFMRLVPQKYMFIHMTADYKETNISLCSDQTHPQH